MKTTRCAAGVLCVVAIGAVGCAEENRRTTLGHSAVDEAGHDRGDVVTLEAFGDGGGELGVDYAVRTRSLDRSGWVATEHVQPVDGVHHTPTYRTIRRTTEDTARQRGEFPTVESASGTDEPYVQEQWRDGAIVAMRTVADAVAMPVWVFVEPVWEERLSPGVVYERAPAGVSVLPATGLPAGADRSVYRGGASPGVALTEAPIEAPADVPATQTEPVYVEPVPAAPVVDDPAVGDPNAGNPFVRPAPAGTTGAG